MFIGKHFRMDTFLSMLSLTNTFPSTLSLNGIKDGGHNSGCAHHKSYGARFQNVKMINPSASGHAQPRPPKRFS